MALSDLPPAIAGYQAAVQGNQQQDMGQLQQMQAVMGLQGQMQQQNKEAQFRQALTSLGPNATQDQLAQVAARFGSANDVLKTQQASLDKKEALAQRATDAQSRLDMQKQSAEQIHEFRMSKLSTDQDRAAESARHNQAMEVLNAKNAELGNQIRMMGLDIKKGQASGAADAAKGKQIQVLGQALERAGLPETDAVLRAVEDKLDKNPKIAEYLSGPKSLLPDMAVDQDIREGRQAFQKLFNITLKNRSGSAVTNQELDRLKSEFAAGAFKTPEQLRAAVDQARNIIGQHYRGVTAGFHPDVVSAYNDNLTQSGGTPILSGRSGTAAPAPAQIREGQTATGPNGQKIMFRGGQWQPAQ